VVIYEGFNDLVPRIFKNYKPDYSHFRVVPARTAPDLISGFINSLYTLRYLSNLFNLTPNLHDYIINMDNLPPSMDERLKNFSAAGTAAFEEHMEYLIHTLQSYNISVIVPTFAFTPDKYDGWVDFFPDELWQTGIAQNNGIIKGLQKSNSLLPLDLFAEFSGRPELFMGKIHFTDEGNLKVATIIGEAVISSLSQ
jgi:hypothetical protein